jgi:hypothetical protein
MKWCVILFGRQRIQYVISSAVVSRLRGHELSKFARSFPSACNGIPNSGEPSSPAFSAWWANIFGHNNLFCVLFTECCRSAINSLSMLRPFILLPCAQAPN